MLSRRALVAALSFGPPSAGLIGAAHEARCAELGQLRSAVGSPESYDNLAEAKATTISPDVHSITLSNRNPDDGASAQYRRASVQPFHDCKFLSRDGAWWELVPDVRGVSIHAAGGVFDAKQFGRGVISEGSNVLHARANFSTADVGKTIQIYGAGAMGGWLVATISEIVNAESVKLSKTALTTATEAPGWWGTDDTAAIQAAIDYGTYFAKCIVYAPSGAAIVRDTLHCGYGITFSATTLEGQGYAYAGASSFRGSALISTFSDRPVINIQGGRGTVVRGFSLVGQALPWIFSNKLGMFDGTLVIVSTGQYYVVGEKIVLSNGGSITVVSVDGGQISQFEVERMGAPATELGSIRQISGTQRGNGATFSCLDDRVHSSWNDPRLSQSGDSRYAPYAAISIDAYCGAPPTPPYPPVSYPAWTGEGASRDAPVVQYNKGRSSDCLLDDLEIRGFNVAIVNQPCNSDGNGDFTSIRRVSMQYNKYCVSIGNGQSRNISWQEVKLSNFYAGITTATHGHQIGQLGGLLPNIAMGQGIKLFILGSTAITGTLSILNLYVEGAYQLGDYIGGSSNEDAIIFQSCKINLGGQNPKGRGVPASTFGRPRLELVPIIFRGCQFDSFPSVIALPNTAVLEDTTILPRNRPAINQSCLAYEAFAHNALAGGVVTHTLFSRGAAHRIKFSPFNLVNLNVAGTFTTGSEYAHSDHTTGLPHYVAKAMPANSPYGEEIIMPQRSTSTPKSNLKEMSVSGLELTFTYTDTAKAALCGYTAGSVIYDDEYGTAFFVHAFDGKTVKATAQNNYESDASGTFVLSGFSNKAGNFWSIPTPLYTPSYPMFGTITAGGPQITEIARGDGFSGWFGSEISVGDWVYVEDYLDRWAPPSQARVTQVDPSGRTITLSGNCTYDAKSKRFPLFVKAAPKAV